MYVNSSFITRNFTDSFKRVHHCQSVMDVGGMWTYTEVKKYRDEERLIGYRQMSLVIVIVTILPILVEQA